MAKCLTIVNDTGRLEVENELRRQICQAGRRMYGSGFIVAREGNLSVRVDPDRILVTPSGVCKGHLLSAAGNGGTIRADLAFGAFVGRTACALSRKRAETDRCKAALRSAPSRRRRGIAAHGRFPGRLKHRDARNSSHALTRLH